MSVEAHAETQRLRIGYLLIGALMVTIALAGFWPSYFGRILPGTLDAPPYIHLHAVIFSGWLVLLMTQASLAASGRVALHMRFGPYIFLYGILLVLVGWFTAVMAFRENFAAGAPNASAEFFVPLTDLLFFAPVLFAAWLYRDKPEIHKRLIIVATTTLLIAATHRFVGHNFGRPPPLGPVFAIWLSPIILGMAYDLYKRRIVHPVYLIGVAVIVAMKFRPKLYRTDAWQDFVAWLGGVLT